MSRHSILFLGMIAGVFVAGCGADSGLRESAAPATPSLLESVTFYASFDEAVAGDFGGGSLDVGTRFDHETEQGQFVFQDGFDSTIFQIASGEGIQGGALRATATLPRRGRIYFPAKGNLPYSPAGWDGAVSFWLKTNPNTIITSRFSDPIQITEKGAGNGGLWIDFPDSSPRNLRLGAFQSEGNGRRRIAESDPNPPLVIVEDVGFVETDWHHIVFTWRNFDAPGDSAEASLYIDGEPQGSIENRNITMAWDLDKTGIYVSVGYIGLLDELAIFDRPLTLDEIHRLRGEPGMLAQLKNGR
jgi:hypothetical protein